MNDQPKGTIFPKQQLEIVTYEGDVPYAGGMKHLDRMTAKNLSLQHDDPLYGKPIRHTIFNGDLKAALCVLEVGTRFVADVEERPRPETEYGPDRTIVQVYVDGDPVSKKKPGGGGGYGGKSPEIVRLEHALEMERVAVEQVGNVLTCDTPIPGEDLGIDEASWKRLLAKYWTAVEKGLDNFQATATTPAATAAKPRQRPQDKPQLAEKPAAEGNDPPLKTDPIKHVGDLLTRASKLDPPVTREDLVVFLALNNTDEIKDLEGAWKVALEIRASKASAVPVPGETAEEAWNKMKRS